MASMNRAEALDRLREILSPGDTVYTTVKTVARSGMSRCLQVRSIKCGADGPVISWLSYYCGCAKIAGGSFNDKTESFRVSGCGMDMGFHTVYSLSWALFKDAPDSAAPAGRGPWERYDAGVRSVSEDRGYWLKHEWLS